MYQALKIFFIRAAQPLKEAEIFAIKQTSLHNMLFIRVIYDDTNPLDRQLGEYISIFNGLISISTIDERSSFPTC